MTQEFPGRDPRTFVGGGRRVRPDLLQGVGEVTSLDIGRTESSEPSPYGSVPEGFMLLYFAAVMLVVLALLLRASAAVATDGDR